MPRWKLASRSLACAADLADAGAADAAVSAPTAPGTRFARGTRLGSPDSVTPPDVGTCAASAARQPSSAGEVQPPLVLLATLFTCPARLAPCLPRRNQSDSTDSNMGSRCSSPAPALAVGGTMIPSFGCVIGVRKGSSLPLPVGPAETGRSPRVGAPYTGSGSTAGADGGLSSSAEAEAPPLSAAGMEPRSNAGAAPASNAGVAPLSDPRRAPGSNPGVAPLSDPRRTPGSNPGVVPLSGPRRAPVPNVGAVPNTGGALA